MESCHLHDDLKRGTIAWQKAQDDIFATFFGARTCQIKHHKVDMRGILFFNMGLQVGNATAWSTRSNGGSSAIIGCFSLISVLCPRSPTKFEH